MPWSIEKRDDEYCVVKDSDGEVEGCHDTREGAVRQIAALNAAESEKNTEYAMIEEHFNLDFLEALAMHLKLALGSDDIDEAKGHAHEALILIKEKKMRKMAPPYNPMPGEEKPLVPYSEEGTQEFAFKKEEYDWEGPIVFEGVKTGDNRIFKPGSISWDNTTLPWAFRWQKSSIKGHDGAVPIGRVDKLERKENGSIYGYGVIIPSLNEEAAEYLRLLEAGVASGVSVDGDSAEFDVQESLDGTQTIEFSSMRLRSLTAVDIPAFNEARIDLEDGDNKEELGGEPSQGTDADLRLKENKKRKKKLRWAYNLTAGAIPVKPKTEWFEDPKFDGPTPITVTEDGAVFGHLALFDTCHIAFPGCVTPPKGSSYKYFHTGEVETDSGDTVDIGHLTFNTGHAAMSDTAKAAASHYDHTGVVAADVRAGEDKYGIWVVGALRPGLSEEDIRTFRAAPLSGDWRRIAGRLELVGALAVNVPGFPVPRARALVASGETETLFTYQESNEAEEIEVDTFEEGLRLEFKNKLSENVFHLIGKHDQGET